MFKRQYFVVAPSFHGSTLLSKLLNDHPNVVSLGDTYPSNRFDQMCGCGEYVSQCPLWQSVAERVGADRYRALSHLLPRYPTIVGRRLDRMLYNILPREILRRIVPTSARSEFAKDFDSFTSVIHEKAGGPEACVYVDGVKSISRVFALSASGVQVDGVIHLYRDPGDYIKSTMRYSSCSWQVFTRDTLNWRLFHDGARKMARDFPYISLAYEGLAEQPETSLREIFAFLGVPSLQIADLVSMRKDRPWHFMGNASLFNFDGSIKRSQHVLSGQEKKLVRLIAGRYSPDTVHLRTGKK